MVGQSCSQSSAGFDLERAERPTGGRPRRPPFKSPGMFTKLKWDDCGHFGGRNRPQRRRESGAGWWGENKNTQRLIVHKSRRSIVSGEPPAALADGVPMKRSKHGRRLGSAAARVAGWVGRSPTYRSQDLRNKTASGTFPEPSGFISPVHLVKSPHRAFLKGRQTFHPITFVAAS